MFVIDRRAISAAETFLAFVAHYKLGILIGEATAGTNGNTNRVLLPGGFRVHWTGMKVLDQDGGQHHVIGVVPNISIKRTIGAVAQGRDEALEEGIRILTQDPKASSETLVPGDQH